MDETLIRQVLSLMLDRDDLVKRVDALEIKVAQLQKAALSEEETECDHRFWRYLNDPQIKHITQCDACERYDV